MLLKTQYEYSEGNKLIQRRDHEMLKRRCTDEPPVLVEHVGAIANAGDP